MVEADELRGGHDSSIASRRVCAYSSFSRSRERINRWVDPASGSPERRPGAMVPGLHSMPHVPAPSEISWSRPTLRPSFQRIVDREAAGPRAPRKALMPIIDRQAGDEKRNCPRSISVKLPKREGVRCSPGIFRTPRPFRWPPCAEPGEEIPDSAARRRQSPPRVVDWVKEPV